MDAQLEQLAKLFLKFPGIGSRQAKRFAYFILSQNESYVKSLSVALTSARAHAHTCTLCHRIFEGSAGLCSLCSDTTRDHATIVVVEKTTDIESFLRTDYNGVFFVLGGLIPIVQKNIIEGTHTHALIERVKSSTDSTELILAFPLTPNGDHTDSVLREMLAQYPIKINSLGRGLSTGTELEYADPASLTASLQKRG